MLPEAAEGGSLVPCVVTVPNAGLPIVYGWFGDKVAMRIVEIWN